MQNDISPSSSRIERLRSYVEHSVLRRIVKGFSSGDRVIFAILAILVSVSTLTVLLSLQRSYLVEIPSRGGSLTEGSIGSPRFVHPLLAVSDADRDLVALTYAGLMGTTGDGSLVPVLAERYEIGDEGRTYTFTIREDAVFHDGVRVTAEDVLFTIEKAQDPLLKSPKRPNWEGVAVEVLDERTVVFHLKEAYAPFLENATLGILPSHVWKHVGVEEFPFTTYTVEPIGAGPYRVQKVYRDAGGILERYELRSFKDYVLGEPYLSRLTLRFYPRAEDLAHAFERGEVESAHSVTNTGAHTMYTAPYSRVFGIFLNQNNNPALARAGVRKALEAAIDRDVLVQEALGGTAQSVHGPIPGEVVAETTRSEEERRAAVAEHLTGAGYRFDEEQGLWLRGSTNPEQLTITVRTSNVAELRASGEIVKRMWDSVGIPTTIEYFDVSDLNQNVIRPRRYDALLFGMIVGRELDLFPFWHSSQRNDPGLNVAMYASADADRLVTTARREADIEKRRALSNELGEELREEVPAIFLYTPTFSYFAPADVAGINLPQITVTSDRFADVHTWYRRTERVWPIFQNAPEALPVLGADADSSAVPNTDSTNQQ